MSSLSVRGGDPSLCPYFSRQGLGLDAKDLSRLVAASLVQAPDLCVDKSAYDLDDAIDNCRLYVNRYLGDSYKKCDIWVELGIPTWTAEPTDGVVLSYDLGGKSLTAADSQDTATTHFEHMVVKVDRLENPLFTEEVSSPELPGGKDLRPVDLSQEQLKELIQRYPDIAQISDRVVLAQYYPFGYGVSMPTWDQDEFVPSQGQSCVVNYPLRLRAITIHTPPKRWGLLVLLVHKRP